jgi:hypothetical protein
MSCPNESGKRQNRPYSRWSRRIEMRFVCAYTVRRTIAPQPYGFYEHVLQVSACVFSCDEAVSLQQWVEYSSFFLNRVRVTAQKKWLDRESRVGNFVNRCAKLSRRLARYQLTITLFQSPLSERGVTVSVSRALSSGQTWCLSASSDTQRHFGSPHCANLVAAKCRPPVPLRPANDLLVLLGGTLPPRLL